MSASSLVGADICSRYLQAYKALEGDASRQSQVQKQLNTIIQRSELIKAAINGTTIQARCVNIPIMTLMTTPMMIIIRIPDQRV